MTHTTSLRLVPADLDRLQAALQRAEIGTAAPFAHPFELVADIEAAVALLALARAALKEYGIHVSSTR